MEIFYFVISHDLIKSSNEQERLLCRMTPPVWKTCQSRSRLPADEAWRLLRMPFVLPVSAKGLHACVWELFDLDCAGCLLCGSIHRCGPEACVHVAQTDDSVVCLITGVCVQPKTYADHEYSENVIVFASAAERMEHVETRMRLVEAYAQEFLTSNDAEKLARYEHQRKLHKYHALIARTLREERHVDLVHIIQQGVHLYTDNIFDVRQRSRIAHTCSKAIQRTICVSQGSLGLTIKDSELRSFVFGMIFLMRNGVTMQNIQLLPCILPLRQILPSENNVGRFLKFRSKYITDTENKFKFLFRHISQSKLHGLHLIDDDLASNK